MRGKTQMRDVGMGLGESRVVKTQFLPRNREFLKSQQFANDARNFGFETLENLKIEPLGAFCRRHELRV